MGILETLKSKNGKIILSVLWGLALAALFKYTCESRDCLVFRAPNTKELTSSTYKHNSECYTFTTETVECNGDEIPH